MKLMWAALFVWITGAAHAQTAWFNIMGDPADDTVDTIEVDPTPVSVSGAQRVMRLRVSRSADRTNWDGVLYRSYVAEVSFDCLTSTASYLTIDYFSLSGWRGEPSKRGVYLPADPRPLRFRDVVPNPAQRIIRAACQTASIITP